MSSRLLSHSTNSHGSLLLTPPASVVSPACVELLRVVSGTLVSWSAGTRNWGCGQRMSTARYTLKDQPLLRSDGWRQEDIFNGAPMSNTTCTFTFSLQPVLYYIVSTQGSFYNESAIVSAQDSEDRDTCVGVWHCCLLFKWFQRLVVCSIGVSRKLAQSDSCPHDPEDRLPPLVARS